jgi:hypothetical protein
MFKPVLISQLIVVAHSFGTSWHGRCPHLSLGAANNRLSLTSRFVTRMNSADDIKKSNPEIPAAAAMCGVSAIPTFLQQQQQLVSQAIPGAQPRIDWSGALSDSGVIPRVMNGVKGSDMPAAKKEMDRSGRSRPDWFRVPAPPPAGLETKYGKLKDSLKTLNLHTVRARLNSPGPPPPPPHPFQVHITENAPTRRHRAAAR